MTIIERLAAGALVGALACMTVDSAGHRHDARRVRPVMSLLNAGFRVMPGLKPRFERAATRMFYDFVNRRSVDGGSSMMNYGYAPLDGGPAIALRPEEEHERSGYQMYHAVAGTVELSGKDVLEVGCGRGGGAAFVLRTLAPRSMTGVDFSARAIAHCIANHRDERLRFLPGDAESLPFQEPSFDAVINVESSHAYPDFDRFLREVRRVLRPSGYLLFADFRTASVVPDLYHQLEAAGFTVLESERITENVLRALEINTQRSHDLVQHHAPRLLRGLAREFMAVEGSEVFNDFRSGELVYLRLVLQKA